MADGFLSRWSKRKAGKQDELLEKNVDTASSSTQALDVQSTQEPTPPPVTLEDVEKIDRFDPDFSAFMKPDVDPAVQQAAMKKMFSDPHFNVMDGLDIYIGDYNTPDPLPAGMLQKMASAQFMNLVPPERPEPLAAEGALLHENPDLGTQGEETAQLVAQSAPSQATTALPDLPMSDHDDPDLQLQPNHAPASPDPGPGAG